MSTETTAVQQFKTGNKNSGLSMVKNLLANDTVKSRFKEILDRKAPSFMASIVSLVSSNTAFSNVDGNTVIGAALIAATLDMPINQNLGFAYIIPYKQNAQFQMGYKGYIQLAIRTGMYQNINATQVYDGELVANDRIKGIIEIDTTQKKSDTIIGYVAYFKLTSGFEKMLYMSVQELKEHGKRYSKTYSYSNGTWSSQFDAMCKKTVLKLLLSKYAILSVEMQDAMKYDQAAIRFNEAEEPEAVYVDAADESDNNESQELFNQQ